MVREYWTDEGVELLILTKVSIYSKYNSRDAKIETTVSAFLWQNI